MSIFSKYPFHFYYKFVIVHVLTYLIFGLLFMFISNYFDYFARDEILNMVMKPSDALSVRLAVPAQFIRGLILASAVYPFREIIFNNDFGWLKLFWLMFVLTGIGAVITGPGSIEGLLYTNFKFNPLIGLPEIAFQMLAFSWLFCKWMKIEVRLIKY